MTSKSVRVRLKKELKIGEKLIWTGKPSQIIVTPFGLYAGGMSILTLTGFTIFTLIVLRALIINPSALIACAFAFLTFITLMAFYGSRLYLKHLLGPSFELYGLTNERVIILSPFLKSEQKSIPLKKIKPVTVEGEDVGTITFENEKIPKIAVPLTAAWWASHDLWLMSDLAYFHKIKNPRQVFDLIKQLHNDAQ